MILRNVLFDEKFRKISTPLLDNKTEATNIEEIVQTLHIPYSFQNSQIPVVWAVTDGQIDLQTRYGGNRTAEQSSVSLGIAPQVHLESNAQAWLPHARVVTTDANEVSIAVIVEGNGLVLPVLPPNYEAHTPAEFRSILDEFKVAQAWAQTLMITAQQAQQLITELYELLQTDIREQSTDAERKNLKPGIAIIGENIESQLVYFGESEALIGSGNISLLVEPGNAYRDGGVYEDAMSLHIDDEGTVYLTVVDTAGGTVTHSENTKTNIGSHFARIIAEFIPGYLLSNVNEPLAAMIIELDQYMKEIKAHSDYTDARSTSAAMAHVSIDADGRYRGINVADCRIYKVSVDGKLTQLTQDYSWTSRQVKDNKMDHTVADNHPQRSIITEAIGSTANRFDPDLPTREITGQLQTGEKLLIVTDGATRDEATSTWLRNAIGQAQTPAEIIANINAAVQQALNEREYVDNTTVLVYQHS